MLYKSETEGIGYIYIYLSQERERQESQLSEMLQKEYRVPVCGEGPDKCETCCSERKNRKVVSYIVNKQKGIYATSTN